MVKSEDKNTIQSVERALEILDLLAEHTELSITAIGEKMGLSKSTAFGLVYTMRKHGYIDQDAETQKYYLGVKFFELATRIQAKLDFRDVALPYMRALQQEYQETISLVILNEADVVYVECLQAYNVLSIKFNVGARLPAHCTASGKCLLAELSDRELDTLFARHPLSRLAQNSIDDLAELKAELQTVRDNGHAFDNEESMAGVAGFAVSIRNAQGRAIAAISLGGPIAQFSSDRKDGLCSALKNAAISISADMGYRP